MILKPAKRLNGYWTEATARRHVDENLQMTGTEFQRFFPGAYAKAIKLGIWGELRSKLRFNKRNNGYWEDFARCKAEANKFGTRAEMKEESNSALKVIWKNGWYDELCSHFVPGCVPDGWYNDFERCRAAGAQAKNRTDFRIRFSAAWNAAVLNGWLDDVCPRGESGFDMTAPAIAYYLEVEDPIIGKLYKIGITNRSIEERFSVKDREKIKQKAICHFGVGKYAYDYEKIILNACKSWKYDGPDVLFSGNTELFTKDVIGLYTSHSNAEFETDDLTIVAT